MRWIRHLLALIIAGTLVFVAAPDTGVNARLDYKPARRITKDFTQFLHAAGGQEITIPDGIYSAAGLITARHRDWLVLKAASPGAVVVDLGQQELRLENSSRIVFAGIRFINGRIYHGGNTSDIQYWYTEHTFPISDPCDGPWRCGLRDPARVIQVNSTGKNIDFYGVDVHQIGSDAFRMSYATDSEIVGARIWDFRFGDDPRDYIHSDAVQTTGNVRNLKIRDTYIQGGPFQMGTENGHNVDIAWENIWSHGSSNAGWIINSLINKNDRSRYNRAIRYRRNNVWSWGHNNGHDRIDAIHDPNGPERFFSPTTSDDPSRIDVTDRNIRTSAPVNARSDREFREHPRNPAMVWRRAHPYGSYADHLDLDVDPGGTPPPSAPSTRPFDFSIEGLPAGGVVTGPLAVEIEPVGVGAPTVDFFIDGRPVRSDKSEPYCLEDGSGSNCRRFDFQLLGDGKHKLRVRLRASKGVVERTVVIDVRR